MSRYGYGGWAPYVSVGQKLALGRAAARKLAEKENRQPQPIKLDGKKIAKTFWGIKWCENLDKYQDFANRLPRGATYVRNGSVADLVIEAGRVRAIVGGSEAYTIEIKIKTLAAAEWRSISRDCAQEIESLFDLLQGRFSDGVMQRLTRTDGGLFPRKKEITMSCSCPDYAGVCKHIAATFYGVAARIDQQPDLLFKLRNVDHLELIGHAANAASLDQALSSASNSSLADSDLSSLFGIDLEASAPPSSAKGKARKTTKAHAKRPLSKKAATVTKHAAKAPTSKSPKKSSVALPPSASQPTKPPKKSTPKTKEKPVVSQVDSKRSAPKVARKAAVTIAQKSPKATPKSPKTAVKKTSAKPKRK